MKIPNWVKVTAVVVALYFILTNPVGSANDIHGAVHSFAEFISRA